MARGAPAPDNSFAARGPPWCVFPPDRARSVVRQSNTEPLCAPAWPAIAGIGATPKDRYGATAPSASSARAIRPRDRAHDRGRCPLYVRAQLDTAGLWWTQRDLAGPKATARKTRKTQLTGYFRRWWQVLGSNQRRLSRRFTDGPLSQPCKPLICGFTATAHSCRGGVPCRFRARIFSMRARSCP